MRSERRRSLRRHGRAKSLSRGSVDFFKVAAKQRRVPYQRMIRALVDAYAEKQEGKRSQRNPCVRPSGMMSSGIEVE
jgi:hypothetical protein